MEASRVSLLEGFALGFGPSPRELTSSVPYLVPQTGDAVSHELEADLGTYSLVSFKQFSRSDASVSQAVYGCVCLRRLN